MFEIVSKTNNLYDVLDTNDGVIESCSFLDIISFCESGIEIEGVSLVNDSYIFEIDSLCCHNRNVLVVVDFCGTLCLQIRLLIMKKTRG